MSNEFELPKSAETKGTKKTKEDPLPPVESSLKQDPNLKEKPKYDPEELISIFDEIIFSGTYTEHIVIRGKLSVAFRSRTAKEIELITGKLDATTANLMATLNEKRSLLNLHYALTSYQGKDLSTISTEDREKFINNLAAPVVGTLINALSKFDSKVYAACVEGEENF
jgi:hypothetical protein